MCSEGQRRIWDTRSVKNPYLSHRQQKQTVPTAMVPQGIFLLAVSKREWEKVRLESLIQGTLSTASYCTRNWGFHCG